MFDCRGEATPRLAGPAISTGLRSRTLLLSIDRRQATLYDLDVIKSFKHRRLKALYDGRTARRVAPAHLEKLGDILAALDCSRGPDDMDLPGFRLHPLKGGLVGYWAASVSGNRRVTFRFEDGHAVEVDYVDYH